MKNNQILQDNLKAYDKATAKIKSFMNGLIDESSFVETDAFACGKSFIDGSQALGEGVVTGYATIDGNPVNVIASNREVLGGSFGQAHANKINKAIAKAVSTSTPLVSIIDCTGARVGEGVAMLESFGEVLFNANVAANNVPHIAIVKGVAVGMMAAYVAACDYVFMAADSVMSVNSPQALASEIKDYPKLNTVLGADAYAANSSVANFVYKKDSELKSQLSALLTIIAGEEEATDDPNRECAVLDKAYSVANAFTAIADDGKFIEYNAGFAKEVRTILTKINGITVGVLATDSAVAGGMITVDGIEKATEFVELTDSNGFALITLVDAKGIKSCIDCEIKGLNKKVAKLARAIANSDSHKIGVITGKATGVVYSLLASKGIGFDYTLATVDAQISPINAETAINLVYAEEIKASGNSEAIRTKLADKYNEMEASPFISAKEGFIDNIIEASTLRPYIASALLMLLGI